MDLARLFLMISRPGQGVFRRCGRIIASLQPRVIAMGAAMVAIGVAVLLWYFSHPAFGLRGPLSQGPAKPQLEIAESERKANNSRATFELPASLEDAAAPTYSDLPLFFAMAAVCVTLVLAVLAFVSRRTREAAVGLQDSESKIKSLIGNSPDLVWAYYFDRRPGFISRDGCGYSTTEWRTGGPEFFISLCAPDAQPRLRKAFEYMKSTGEGVTNLKLKLVEKDERHVRSFLVNMTPIVDDAARVIGVQGVNHDITELETAQKALQESEARFWDIVETAHDLAWSMDRDGRWTYLNQATRHIYGYEAEQMLGRNMSEVTHPDHKEKDEQVFRQALEGKEITEHETTHLHQDGSARHLSFNIKPRMDSGWNIVGAMGTARDITEQKLYQRRLEHLAEHDALTGLYNRHYFQRELDKTMANARHNQKSFGLLYIDVDNFKYVNDTLGHAAGDQLLIELSLLQRERLRKGDILARFGGDEFTVLLQDMDRQKIHEVTESFHQLFQSYTFVQDDKVFDIRVSIGAALITDGAGSSGDVLAQADLACALAKSSGRNRIHIYDPADLAKAGMVSDMGWSRKIHEALEHDRFVLLFQPIIKTKDQIVEHYEVLLRMRNGDDALTAPGAFLSTAERFGLIHSIDRWVVEHAIARLGELHRRGMRYCFSINLSGRAFQDRELLPRIREALEKNRLNPLALTFEITETAAISHIAHAKEFIEQLRALGCRFALDDFGSGFSSYGYLKFLPVDYLKIDGNFVQRLADDPVDQAMVQSMNQVAHALGKQTIAECVENEASLRLLRSYNVDCAQGFYLGRPLSEIK